MNRLAQTGAQIRQWIEARRLTATTGRRDFRRVRCARRGCRARHGGRAFFRHCRRSARSLICRAAGNILEYQWHWRMYFNAIKKVFASLYNDRAIAYRVHQNFPHAEVALSAGVQRMVRSDIGAAGVMFTLDTESGFDQVVFITAAYGLGETVVQGAVNPDEFYVYKRNSTRGRPAILRKTRRREGDPDVYSPRFASAGQSVTTRRRSAVRTQPVLDQRCRGGSAGADCARSSSAITGARWTSSGGATASTASSTSCRRDRRR